MRSVGKRQVREITENASGELLKQGAMFNDELHKLPTGSTTHMRKGIYRFSSHKEANRHQEESVIEGMVEYANE
ncbi:MAG: hypothetical protein ABW166_14900 [Sedimenticola sp.]